MDDLLDIYKLWKRGTGSRDDFLLSAAQIEGVYVPKFYDISYADDAGSCQSTLTSLSYQRL